MDKLKKAFNKMKKSGNCNAYVGVIADQLLKSESNKQTKDLNIVEKFDKTL